MINVIRTYYLIFTGFLDINKVYFMILIVLNLYALKAENYVKQQLMS